MTREIIEKEIPLAHAPKPTAIVIVETNHEGSDEIEFAPEVRQRREGFDVTDDSFQSEHARHFRIHRHFVGIETDRAMPEPFANVEEIARARTDIENISAPSVIEFEVAHMAEIDLHPLFQIEIFRPG